MICPSVFPTTFLIGCAVATGASPGLLKHPRACLPQGPRICSSSRNMLLHELYGAPVPTQLSFPWGGFVNLPSEALPIQAKYPSAASSCFFSCSILFIVLAAVWNCHVYLLDDFILCPHMLSWTGSHMKAEIAPFCLPLYPQCLKNNCCITKWMKGGFEAKFIIDTNGFVHLSINVTFIIVVSYYITYDMIRHGSLKKALPFLTPCL